MSKSSQLPRMYDQQRRGSGSAALGSKGKVIIQCDVIRLEQFWGRCRLEYL